MAPTVKQARFMSVIASHLELEPDEAVYSKKIEAERFIEKYRDAFYSMVQSSDKEK